MVKYVRMLPKYVDYLCARSTNLIPRKTETEEDLRQIEKAGHKLGKML